MPWPLSVRPRASLFAANYRTACRFKRGISDSPVDCVAQCENILSIDQAQLDLATGPMGILDEAALEKVIKSIGYVIKSDCKPL